jgi:hypothetical protein
MLDTSLVVWVIGARSLDENSPSEHIGVEVSFGGETLVVEPVSPTVIDARFVCSVALTCSRVLTCEDLGDGEELSDAV